MGDRLASGAGSHIANLMTNLMTNLVANLVANVERRSTGMRKKRWTYRLQFASALVFGLIAGWVFPRAPWLGVVFVCEALGQLLLAAAERRSAARGDPMVSYFRPGALGAGAAGVLLVGSTARYVIAATVLGTGSLGAVWVGALVLLPALLYVALRVAPGTRADLVSGASIAASAVVLGAAFAIHGCAPAAISQLAYGALLVVGVLALEPWVAEALNIPLFASAALWVSMC